MLVGRYLEKLGISCNSIFIKKGKKLEFPICTSLYTHVSLNMYVSLYVYIFIRVSLYIRIQTEYSFKECTMNKLQALF